MKVVLATPPDPYITKSHYQPLNLAYIASNLDAHGYDVTIVDPTLNNYDAKRAAEEISSHKPDAVGVTATTHNRFQAIELIDRTKELTDSLILAGGKHFTPTAVDALRNIKNLDVVVRQEGEITTPELLDVYFKDGDLSAVRGITYRDNGKIVENPPREYVKDLESLPMPAFHLIEHEKYKPLLEGDANETVAFGVISTRGCPNVCAFCSSAAFWGRSLRRRDPKKFVDEIELLNTKYGYRGFELWDDTFTINKTHVTEVCNEIMQRKLDIKWHARGRVNAVNKEMISLMKRAGCIGISYGIESGSQRILNNIHKNITIPQVLDAVKTTTELGLNITTFFMHSHPGETIEDIDLTINLMKKIYSISNQGTVPYRAVFTRIYPGTEIEDLAKKEGLLPKEFSWNRPYIFPLPHLLNTDPTIPLYENPNLKIEQILLHLYRKNFTIEDMVSMGLRILPRIKSLEELKIAFKIATKYLWKATNPPSIFADNSKSEN